ncbi:hypothetical protein H5410_033242 [Solanum commersonii]|uniref:DUF1985 domain-containing protein n=1 Tax=Solanum commersonii TaxID=4109 RepID=A0A9J5YQ78_SOLCO|nr:hypothetical protein H5410_033242 [Solanum commersonii]
MPVCFGMKEFAIVTGLRCHPPSEPLPKVARLRKPREKKISKSVKVGKKDKKLVNTKTNKGKEKLNNENELLPIIGPSYKAKDLIEDLQSKKILKKHKERLCLVWFVHVILWAEDINNVTMVHLLQHMGHLLLQQTGHLLYIHGLSPQSKRLNLIKKELVGATTIKRDAHIVSSDADDVAIDVGVDVDVNVGVDIGDPGAKSGGEHVDDVGGIYGGFNPFSGHIIFFAPSSRSCSACKFEECKNKKAQLIFTSKDVKNSLDALTSAVKKLISKRCIISSRKNSESFTSLKIKRKRKSIFKILSNMKKETTNCNYSSSLQCHPLQHMIHLLQLIIHLLDTCPELETYPICKSIVVTDESSVATGKPSVAIDESSGAADDSSIAINNLSVGTNFWFSPSLTWYCNMYSTDNLSVVIDDLPVGYTTVIF